MAFAKHCFDHIMLWFLVGAFALFQACSAHMSHNNSQVNRQHPTTSFFVDASKGRQIPSSFYGIFFEEINHAGAGGLWAELVSNRGFEAGGSRYVPSMISPWSKIGDEETISIVTELSSCFKSNPVALRMDIHCDQTTCPPGGVGIYNPGYWGMDIEEGTSYKVVFYVKSTTALDAVMSLVSADGTQVLAFQRVMADAEKVKNWTRMELTLQSKSSNKNSRLQFTTSQKGTIWLDQVSAMPNNTYKGHGYRLDLMAMLLNLKPRFLRFPGGCYVEGNFLSNAFRWKETVGPWEERPGHLGDVWNYWSDDGLGYLEYLQLAEDLGAAPVWVVNNGIGIKDQVDTTLIEPFVQEMLDSVEFARGSPNSTWGSLRAKMGHPQPFNLKIIAFGNEGCDLNSYTGNYLQFYKALKKNYPDMKVISNCDATQKPLDHPADIYDFHRYTDVQGMLDLTQVFGKVTRDDPNAPKAFVSEYAVIYPQDKVRNGSFGGALAEAAFLLSLEQNSDVVEMVSYAPLFVNLNDRTWNPDAIFFNSYKAFGIASYWVQTFFRESSGALLLNVHFPNSLPKNTYVTAISWTNQPEKKNYIKVKVVNYNNVTMNMKISIGGVDPYSIKPWRKTVLTCDDLLADNTLDYPTKVVPRSSLLESETGKHIVLKVEPYSFTAFDMINNGQSPKLQANQLPNKS